MGKDNTSKEVDPNRDQNQSTDATRTVKTTRRFKVLAWGCPFKAGIVTRFLLKSKWELRSDKASVMRRQSTRVSMMAT